MNLNKNWVDFHMHSTISDGSLNPKDLIRLAARRKIKTISLTDHDNIHGIKIAKKVADDLGVKLIPGVEISAVYPKGTLHLLGYFIDIESEFLTKKLSQYKYARNTRNQKILDKLNRCGIDINMEDVHLEDSKKTIGRPHIAQALIRKGIVGTIKEAFDKYLANNGDAYVDKEIFSAKDAIDIIHQAGGKAFVAHPVTLYLKGADLIDYLENLKKEGMDGLEVYTTAHNKENMRLFRDLAINMGFLISGGSDFHGTRKPKVDLGFCHDGNRISKDWVSECFH